MPRPMLLLAAAACAIAVACVEEPALGPPSPESMTPPSAYVESTTVATVSGRGFYLEPQVSYVDEADSRVGSRFRAFLGSTELGGVTRIDSHTLEVTVPAALPVGVHDLRIVDPGGQEGELAAAFEVLALPCLLVTTPADEANPAESAFPPHAGLGLSLREAIVLASARTSDTCIGFAAPMTIPLGTAGLPVLSGPAIDVDGGGTVVLDGAAVTTSSIGLDFTVPGSRLRGLRVESFAATSPGIGVRIVGGSVVEDSALAGNRVGVFLSGTGSLVTRSRFEDNSTAGVRVRGPGATISDSVFLDGGLLAAGVDVGETDTRIHRNAFLRSPRGVSLDSAANAEIDHNTFFDGGVAVIAFSGVTGTLVRNSIITDMSVQAVVGDDTEFLEIDYVDFFDNNGSPCSACTLGANCLFTDPDFVDAAADDLSLAAGSPAIDTGIATGLDVNGAAPGLFNGLGPDLGGEESP